ncbi:MAG TPA: dipeptide ABC transporter ATP-binding protein [Candidatus Limnocylindrales bacterium]|nr:dipeptide ABC transporter ATP-binding protein [Candidatus Limnocylindrales bacterium]
MSAAIATDASAAGSPLVRAVGLTKEFRISSGPLGKSRTLRAVDAVDLEIREGRTLGIVGESGCGKSTLGRLLLRLLEPTAGRVEFDGVDLASLDRRSLRAARRHMQIVFQDPYASLNPRMRIGRSVGEGLEAHGIASGSDLRARVGDLLDRVGLGTDSYDRYPHEFSGGQRQRIGIARALALSPRFIVADEPVSALDVSIGAQILNLLMDLQEERGLAFAFISHDLRVVEHISHDMAVMYLGRVVETAPSARIYAAPQHPYTQALLSAVPTVDGATRKQRIVLGGDVPSPVDPPSGCVFHPRCPYAFDRCRVEVPALVDRDGHKAACHLLDAVQP